jgi:hypothetical protein
MAEPLFIMSVGTPRITLATSTPSSVVLSVRKLDAAAVREPSANEKRGAS